MEQIIGGEQRFYNVNTYTETMYVYPLIVKELQQDEGSKADAG